MRKEKRQRNLMTFQRWHLWKMKQRVAGKAKVRKNAAKVRYGGFKRDVAVRRCNPQCCNSRERKIFAALTAPVLQTAFCISIFDPPTPTIQHYLLCMQWTGHNGPFPKFHNSSSLYATIILSLSQFHK